MLCERCSWRLLELASWLGALEKISSKEVEVLL